MRDLKALSLAAIPSSLRRLNERLVLNRLRRMGLASRAELAKVAGISQPTAGKIIDELLAFGLIEELNGSALGNGHPDWETPRLGRPARLLRLDTVRPRFVGIELGVDQTRVAALPLASTGDAAWSASFATGDAPAEWLRRLKAHATPIGADSLWGVVVSVPGVVDEAGGRVLYSPNLHWTERVQLPQLVGETWPLPVLLLQEIRALALGHLSANPGSEDFLLVDFGEGVGGAVIEGGQLFSHPLPLSAELGHTPVLGNDRLCGCGASGCVETLLSRRGLLQSFAAEIRRGAGDLSALANAIANSGLPTWLGASLDAMGAIIAGALNVLGLRRVVVTGHLTELPPVVVERLARAVERGAMWARFGAVICEAAPRRRMAGLVAAGIDRLLVPTDPKGPLHKAARQRMNQTARPRRNRAARSVPLH